MASDEESREKEIEAVAAGRATVLIANLKHLAQQGLEKIKSFDITGSQQALLGINKELPGLIQNVEVVAQIEERKERRMKGGTRKITTSNQYKKQLEILESMLPDINSMEAEIKEIEKKGAKHVVVIWAEKLKAIGKKLKELNKISRMDLPLYKEFFDNLALIQGILKKGLVHKDEVNAAIGYIEQAKKALNNLIAITLKLQKKVS